MHASPNTIVATSTLTVRETVLAYIAANADQLSLHRLVGTAFLGKEYAGVYVYTGSSVLPGEVFRDEVGVPFSVGLGGVLSLSTDAGVSGLCEKSTFGVL